MRRVASVVLLWLGTAAVVLSLTIARWAWVAVATPDPVMPSAVVASEPTPSGTVCQGSSCVSLSSSELVLDHYDMLKAERQMVVQGFLTVFCAGAALVVAGGVLRRGSTLATTHADEVAREVPGDRPGSH